VRVTSLVKTLAKQTISVLLVDDHRLVRRGFRRILEDEPDLLVVGEAGGAREGVRLARERSPSIVLMDYALPDATGLEAAREIIETCSATFVVMLSMYSEDNRMQEALQAGARGYLVKSAVDMELAASIRRVVAGELLFPASIEKRAGKQPNNHSGLSPRELEILRLIVEGKTNREIADLLHLSVNTVLSHRGRIMKTLRIHKTAELVTFAVRTGLASII
jgi:DNA-binding NarL/FixJ family response regulator